MGAGGEALGDGVRVCGFVYELICVCICVCVRLMEAEAQEARSKADAMVLSQRRAKVSERARDRAFRVVAAFVPVRVCVWSAVCGCDVG